MADVDISIRPSGPYLVRGPISLHDADGNAFDLTGKDVVALCRCGGPGRQADGIARAGARA